MIRIQVRPHLRNLAVATVALGSLANAGCAADTDDETADLEQGLTTAPGRGVVRLQGFSFGYQSTSGGDEFVRSGERLVAELSFDELVYTFDYPERDSLTPANVRATARITWLDAAGAPTGTANVPVRWGTGAASRVGTTASFLVPRKTAAAFSVDFFVEGAGKSFLISERFQVPHTFPVFGYELPSKLALFDNGPTGPRTRIVEGGNFVAGNTARISMVDWRADAVVDRSRLDARYGRRMAGGRFGSVVVDAIAPIEYEIGVAYTADGTNWAGLGLAATPNARVLQTQNDTRRVAYEGSVLLPRASRQLRMAFNVRAFLVVPNYGSEVFDTRYAPGSRVLLADRWDNAGGADYRLPVSTR